MRISKGFLKSSLVYTLAGALPMASAVILLPFYILYLPTEVYGALSICLAFSYLIQVLVTYSFDSALYIHFHELKSEPKKLAGYVSSAFIFMVGLGLAIGVFLTLTGQLVFTWFLSEAKISFYPYGLVSTGLGIVQAIFKVHGNLLQTREKPETFFWSNVASFFVIAATTIVGLKIFPNTLIGPLGGRLLAGTLAAVWVLFRVFKEFGFHFSSPWKYTSFSFNVFTFLYQIQQWIVNYIDRFIIMYFLPLSAVGTYEFAAKCLVPVELLLNGLNASINPKIVKLISQQTKKESTPMINRYFYGSISVIMLAVSLSILAVPIAIEIFIKKNGYAQALEYIPYLAIIFIFKCGRLYFVLPYGILKKMKELMTINFFASSFKIVIMIIFIIQWQLYGVIWSSMITFLLEMVLLRQYLKNDYTIKVNVYKLTVVPFLLFLVVLIAEPLLGIHYPLWTHIGYCIICVAFLGFAYRNEIQTLELTKLIK